MRQFIFRKGLDARRVVGLCPAEPDDARTFLEKEAQETGVKEDVLETMDPVPGQCERGFVVLQTLRGGRPEFVVFEEQFESKTDTLPIRWTVPDAHWGVLRFSRKLTNRTEDNAFGLPSRR